MSNIKLEKILEYLLTALLFLFPWQTIWIYKVQFLNGVKWEYGTLGFYVTEGLLWACVMLFIAWYWGQMKNYRIIELKNFKLTKDRVFVLSLFIFVLYCFLTIFWSVDKNVALQHSLHIMEAVLLFLMLFSGPLSIQKEMLSFFAGSIIPSILGIGQFLMQSTVAGTLLGLPLHIVSDAGTSVIVGDGIGRWLRAYGTFSHPNVFGGYLVVTLMMVFVLSKRYKIQIPRYKTVVIGIVGVQILALFFTFSRAAWLGAGIVLLSHCFFAVREKKYFSILYLGICILYLVTLFFPLIQVRTEVSSANEIGSVTERMTGYREAIKLWKKNPWLGVGVGNYTATIFQENNMHPGWDYQPVHDVPLLFVSELGLFGFILFCFVILSFIRFQNSEFRIQNFWYYVICVMCYAPLAAFDHYLFSSYVGLILTAVYWAIAIKSSPQFLHSPSTQE